MNSVKNLASKKKKSPLGRGLDSLFMPKNHLLSPPRLKRKNLSPQLISSPQMKQVTLKAPLNSILT